MEKADTTPLLDKLGLRPGMRVALLGVADPWFLELVAGRTSDVTLGSPLPDTDIVLLAADSVTDLADLASLRAMLRPNGAIWVVSRKGRAATLRYADLLGVAKAAGLIDNKVASFSDTHTALRFVIPVALRPRG